MLQCTGLGLVPRADYNCLAEWLKRVAGCRTFVLVLSAILYGQFPLRPSPGVCWPWEDRRGYGLELCHVMPSNVLGRLGFELSSANRESDLTIVRESPQNIRGQWCDMAQRHSHEGLLRANQHLTTVVEETVRNVLCKIRLKARTRSDKLFHP